MLKLLDRNLTPRLALLFVTILLKLIASGLAAVGFVLRDPAFMIVGTIIWLVWLISIFLVALPATDKSFASRLSWLKPMAKAIIFVLAVVALIEIAIIGAVFSGAFNPEETEGQFGELLVTLERTYGYNDSTALSHQATTNFLDGDNPYAESNIVSALITFDGAFDNVTPLREGQFANAFPYPDSEELEAVWLEASQYPEEIPVEYESHFNYPAGVFLLAAPFVAIGFDDLRVISLIIVLPAMAYVIWRAPTRFRFLLVAGILISLELWNSIAAGDTGLLYFPFLILGWLLVNRKLYLSAFFMGLAIAIKQMAWFFLPFYLILVWRTQGLKKAVLTSGITASLFLAANLPFFIQDPQLWVESILAPMSQSFFPLGVGVVSFVSAGALNVQTALPFTILEFMVYLVGLWWYFRAGYRYPNTGLILAVVPLFFAWRSLWTYFYFVDIILLSAIIINEYRKGSILNEYDGRHMNEKLL